MNREQKRKTIKSLTAKGYTKEQAEALTMLKATQETRACLKKKSCTKYAIMTLVVSFDDNQKEI